MAWPCDRSYSGSRVQAAATGWEANGHSGRDNSQNVCPVSCMPHPPLSRSSSRQHSISLSHMLACRYDAYFVDLFVRVSNKAAIQMYHKVSHQFRQLRTLTPVSESACHIRRALPSTFMQFGYTVYRRVLNYYSGEEDAFGKCSPSF